MKLNWRTRLYLFAIILGVVPLAISSINMISITQDELKSNVNSELINTTTQLADKINQFYEQNWFFPVSLVKRSMELNILSPEDIQTMFSAVIENSDDIYSIALLIEDTENNTLQNALLMNKQVAKEESGLFDIPQYFNENYLSEKRIGQPEYFPVNDLWLLPNLIPLKLDFLGDRNAYLLVKIRLNQIREAINNHPYNYSGKIILIDESAKQVFDNENKTSLDNPIVKKAFNLLKENKRMQSVVNETYGENQIVGSFAFPENLPWIVIAQIDEKDAYIAVSRMKDSLMYWVVIGLFVALISVWIYYKQATRPIKTLTFAAEKVSSGDFDITVDYKHTDEIGFLARTLENMSSSLKKSFKEIERQNKELEDYSVTLEEKVEARTIELKEKNEQLQELIDELKRTKDRLVMQEKLASLGALTAGIAHEIRNPLNFVNNFSKVSIELVKELSEELDDLLAEADPKDKDYLDEIVGDIRSNITKINNHGQRAESIVKSMLEHSRTESGQFRDDSVIKHVEEAVNLARQSFCNDHPQFEVIITKEFAENPSLYHINPQALIRVFINICSNAFYAMNKKFSTDAEYKPELKIVYSETTDGCSIQFIDNGTGMDDKVKQKIFEPFFTTKPPGEGTGLGMSLSFDIISTMHGGSVAVESEIDKFTKFEISLPFDEVLNREKP